MLEVAVCNSSISEIERLAEMLEQYGRSRPQIPLRVWRFQSLYDMADRIRMGCTFHVCLLDQQPRQAWMNGLSAGALLRQRSPEMTIIGFTGDPHAAYLQPVPDDPLGLSACLAKPVSQTALFEALDGIAADRLPALELPALRLPTRQGQRQLPFCQLIRAHYHNHVVWCCMAGGEVVESTKLRVPFNQIVQPLLQERSFCWASASCVINLEFAVRLDKEGSTVEMSDGEVIPVPKAAFPSLRESFEKYREQPGL